MERSAPRSMITDLQIGASTDEQARKIRKITRITNTPLFHAPKNVALRKLQ